jgi:hypothetical protein
MPMGEKGLKEVYDWVDNFTEKNKEIAYKKILGKSPENWDIPVMRDVLHIYIFCS